VKFASMLLAVSCWLSAAFAVQPSFDAREVVRQVRSVTRPASGVEPQALDDGEFLIDTSAVHADEIPAVAFDGVNFLVVWQDYRSGNQCDIYGARVTPQGTVLDPSGFVITQAAGRQFFPALGFDGANFLVVWEDDRGGYADDIYGARVTPQGTVLDPSGFVITPAADYQRWPALGFDGSNFLVVWSDGRSGSGDYIYGARVTPAGTVLDPLGFAIPQASNYQWCPALAFDGANFLVVWQDWSSGNCSDVYGARVTPQGTVLDSQGLAISRAAGDQGRPAVASDGANSLVVWYDLSSGSRGIHGARVDQAGTVLDSLGITISAGWQSSPAVAFDGANSLVAWEDDRGGSDYDVYGAWVSRAGAVFGRGLVVSQEGIQAALALARGSGSQLFLVYDGWAGVVGGKTYNTTRVWGKMNPSPGIEESPKPRAASPKPTATVVRSILYLSEAASGERLAACAQLLDISGRKVLDLHPGANDVSGLSPGVYFVREQSAFSSQHSEPSAVGVRKVLILR
jgi:hypothetical protein